MHHFVTEMCTCVHISATKWYIVGYLSNALCHLWDRSIQKVDINIAEAPVLHMHQAISNHHDDMWLHKPIQAGKLALARSPNASENFAGRVENRPGQVEFCIGYIRDYPVRATKKFLVSQPAIVDVSHLGAVDYMASRGCQAIGTHHIALTAILQHRHSITWFISDN